MHAQASLPLWSRKRYEHVLWNVDRWTAIGSFLLAVPILVLFFRPHTFRMLLASFVLALVVRMIAKRAQEQVRTQQELVDAGHDSVGEIEGRLSQLRWRAVCVKAVEGVLVGTVSAGVVVSFFRSYA